MLCVSETAALTDPSLQKLGQRVKSLMIQLNYYHGMYI